MDREKIKEICIKIKEVIDSEFEHSFRHQEMIEEIDSLVDQIINITEK